jgi:hypothetical protein
MVAEKVDYLDVDTLTVPGQTYALVSFVSPTGNQKNEKMGMKLRGVFSTPEEAKAHVHKLMKMDSTMDIYLMEMYKWVLIPPDPQKIDDHEYQDDFLNTMMIEYKKNQLEAKRLFDERKRAVMEQGLDANLLPEEKIAPGGAPPPLEVDEWRDTHPSVAGSSS